MVKSYQEKDAIDSVMVDAFYSYEQYKALIDDFICNLHEAENWVKDKGRKPDNIVIAFRVHCERDVAISIIDGSTVLPCVGIEVLGIGEHHENNEMGVSSKTNFKRGEPRRDTN